MPRTPKPGAAVEPEESDKEDKESAKDLDEDQQKHPYYYDDAHGYENYVPDETRDKTPEDQA